MYIFVHEERILIKSGIYFDIYYEKCGIAEGSGKMCGITKVQ